MINIYINPLLSGGLFASIHFLHLLIYEPQCKQVVKFVLAIFNCISKYE